MKQATNLLRAECKNGYNMGTIRQDEKFLQRLSAKSRGYIYNNSRYINVRAIRLDSPSQGIPFIFNQWLVGFTDGDGTFTIDRQKGGKKWNLVFKLNQAKVNGQLMHFIKICQGIGHITYTQNRVTYRVRDRNHLTNIIFPIFDAFPQKTTKYLDYLLIKEASNLIDNRNSYTTERFNEKMEIIYSKLINIRESGVEYEGSFVLTDDWLLGFWEAEGSLYIVDKAESGRPLRLSHGLGITQKKDRRILEQIRIKLVGKANVKFNRHGFYSWDSTSKIVVNKAILFFQGRLKGRKSLTFAIWKKSLNYTGDKLKESRDLIRKVIKSD